MKDAILFFFMGNTDCLPLIETVCQSGFIPIANDQGLLEMASAKNLSVLNFGNFAPDGNLERSHKSASEMM